ncbi:MAG: autotransporter-associated beta strand repeat-containing protein, partial [Planctomycetes bacterium]|nr:autotransporter-associated beta strand repeat-containing protein [Planctomycetota bacterium]
MARRNGLALLGMLVVATLGLALVTPAALAVDGTWAADIAGNWSDTTKWVDAAIPEGVDATAYINMVNIAGNRTIQLDSGIAGAGVTLGSIYFDDTTSSHRWELTTNAGKTLTFDVSSGSALIDSRRRDHVIRSAISTILMDNLIVNVQDGGTCYLETNISMGTGLTGLGITKTGGSALTLRGFNTFDGGVTVSAGTLTAEARQAMGTANATVNGGNLRIRRPDALAAGATVTINSTGTLSAHGIMVDPTTAYLNAGGTLRGEDGEWCGWLGPVVVADASVTFGTNNSEARLVLGSTGNVISGGGEATTLNVTASGVIVLDVANTVQGTWALNSGNGALSIAADDRLGDAVNDVRFTNNSRLRATENITLGADRTLTVKATSAQSGWLEVVAGKTLTLATAGQLAVDTGGTNTGTYSLNGGGKVSLSGDGTMALITGTGEISPRMGTVLELDNSVTNNTDRIPDAVKMTMRGGNLSFVGKAGEAASETMGILTFDRTQSVVTSEPGAEGTNALTFASLARTSSATGGTAKFAGTGLGTAGNQILFTTAPTLTNGILPYAFVGSEFATYGPNGITADPTGIFVYGATIDAALVTENVKLQADDTYTGGINKTVSAVHMNGFNLDLGTGLLPAAYTLTLGGSGLISTGEGRTITRGDTFGQLSAANELIAYVDGDLTISTPLAGAINVVKSGPGTLKLADTSGSWGLNKALVINEGTVSIAAEGALGASTNQVTLGQGGTLQFDGLTGPVSLGTLRQINLGNSGGANYGAGGIIDVQGAFDVTITGKITGGPGNDFTALTKTGPGRLIISSTDINDFVGNVRILGGTLTAACSDGDNNKRLRVFGHAANDLYIDNATLEDLYSLDFGTNKTVTVGPNGATFSVAAGKTTQFNDPEQLRTIGTPNLTKTGPGTLTLDWWYGGPTYFMTRWCGLSNDASFDVVDVQDGRLQFGGYPTPRLEAGDLANELRLTGAGSSLRLYAWSQPGDVRPINQKIVIGAAHVPASASIVVSRQTLPVTMYTGDVEFKDIAMEGGSQLVIDEDNTRVLVNLTLRGNVSVGKTGGDDIEALSLVSDAPGTPRTLTLDEGQVFGIRGWSSDVTINVNNGNADLRTDLSGLLTTANIINLNAPTAKVTARVNSVSGAGDPPFARYDAQININATETELRVAQETTVANPSVGVAYLPNVTVAAGVQVYGYKSGNQEYLVSDLRLLGDVSYMTSGPSGNTSNATLGDITGVGGVRMLTINTTSGNDNTIWGTLTNVNVIYAPATNNRYLNLNTISAGGGAYTNSCQLNGNTIYAFGQSRVRAYVDPGLGTIDMATATAAGARAYLEYDRQMGSLLPGEGWGDNTTILVGNKAWVFGRVDDTPIAGERNWNRFNGPIIIKDNVSGDFDAYLSSSRSLDISGGCEFIFENVQVDEGATVILDQDNARMLVNFNQQGGAAGFVRDNDDGDICIGGVRGSGTITIQGPLSGNRTQNLVGVIETGATLELDDSTSASPYRLRAANIDWPEAPGFEINGGTLQITRSGTSYFAEVWPETQIGNGTNDANIIIGKAGVTATGGLEIRTGHDGLDAAFGPKAKITLQYGGALRGFVQQGVDTAVTQVINAPITVTDADADPTTVDGVLASSKSDVGTQGSIIGTVQFQDVTLYADARIRADALNVRGTEAVLIGGPGGSLMVDSGKAALVNNSSDTLVTVENSDGGTLVLAGTRLTQIKGTVLNYGLQIGEGWTDPVLKTGALPGGALILPTADLSGLGAGGVDVWANGDLRLAVAFTGTLAVREAGWAYAYQAFNPTTLTLEKDSNLALLADGSFPVEPTMGAANIYIGKLNFTGTLVLNTGAGDGAKIGVYGADVSINDPIATGAAGAATVKFLDGSTAAYAGSILSLGDGVDPDTKVMLADLAGTDATTTAVVIDRNMLIENKSTYTGGTTIDSSGAAGTSGASDNTVVVAHKNGLGTGNVTLQAASSPALKTTLSLCAADFALGVGNKIIVNERTDLRIYQDTDVTIELAGGSLTATGDVALGGTIALGAGD